MDWDTVLDTARQFADEGKFQESLEILELFHNKACEYDEALSQVRRTIALADWVDLANKYPPASAALFATRDKKSIALENGHGSPNLFRDVVAINEYLRNPSATAALFILLHRSYPRLAARCFVDAEDSLIAAREYAIVMCYIEDALAYYRASATLYRSMLQHAGAQDATRVSSFADSASRLFAKRLNGLFQALQSVGRTAEAQRLRVMALSEFDSDILRVEISELA